MFAISQPVDAVVVLGGCRHRSDHAACIAAVRIEPLSLAGRLANFSRQPQSHVAGVGLQRRRQPFACRGDARGSHQHGSGSGAHLQLPSPKDAQEEAEAEQSLLQGKRFAGHRGFTFAACVTLYQQLGLEPIPTCHAAERGRFGLAN